MSFHSIKCLQINLHHCMDAMTELNNYVNNYSIDLIFCQDPFIFDGKISGIDPSWSAYLSNNNNAAIINTNPDYVTIMNVALPNSVAVSICVTGDPIVLVSQYSSPSSNIDLHFNDLKNHFNNFDKVLIAGDFNVPLLEFGYTRQTERSETFLEHLVSCNLKIVNDVDAPHTFIQGDLKGRPDLTLAGIDICQKIDSWFVDDVNFSFSDHRYIRFDLGYIPEKISNIRYKTKNKSFAKFNKQAKNAEHVRLHELLKVKTVVDLDDHVEDLMTYITELADINFRKGSASYRPTYNWYNNSLKEERNKVAAAYKRYNRSPDNEIYKNTYIIYRNQYKKNIRKVKREAWLKYCEKTEDAFGSLYKHISGKASRPTDFIFTRLNESEVFDTYNEVAETLLNAHFGINEPHGNVYEYQSDKIYTDETIDEVSTRELKYALNCQSNNKAPGADRLDALIIKNFCKSCKIYVRRLLTLCLKLGHFPKCWKKGLVIFFRKRNKDGLTPRSYRPITLLSVMGKILERIIKIRIMPNLEYIGFLDDSQHGFREGRSTVTAMHYLRNRIEEKLLYYNYVSMTSIDIQAAFDAVIWRILATIIDNLPLPEHIRSILKNYISHRYIGMLFTNGVRWFQLFKGCPQGSCIGPLLWLIVADCVIKMFKELFEDILSYADDFVVLGYGDTRNQLEYDMNGKLNRMSEITENLGLTISIEKCISMMFGKNLLEDRHPIYKIRGIKVPVKEHITYLGFKLDSKINWIEHFEVIREKIRSFTINIKKTHKRDKGIPPSYRKIWYERVIERQILYGAEVWGKKLHSHAIRKLKSCQRIGMTSIIRSYRTISTDALCVLSGIVPILIKIKYIVMRHDVLNNNVNIDMDGENIDGSCFMKNVQMKCFPNYNIVKNIIFTKQSDAFYREKNYRVAYTDGSKMNEGVGCAFVIIHGNNTVAEKKICLHKLNSIYQAELNAIKHVLYWFSNSDSQVIVIFTDSKSSFLSLQRLFPSNDLIKEIYTIIATYTRKQVILGWIKAHAGNDGNERADQLAKQAIYSEQADITENLPYPLSLLKYYYKNKELKEWQENWNDSPDGRDTYGIIKTVSREYICNSQVVQYFISAHGSFPSYLKKIGRRRDNLCDCGRKGDVVHFIFGNCPLMPHHFKFNSNLTLRRNLVKILFDPDNYKKLASIYNVLNERYSFIKYRF